MSKELSGCWLGHDHEQGMPQEPCSSEFYSQAFMSLTRLLMRCSGSKGSRGGKVQCLARFAVKLGYAASVQLLNRSHRCLKVALIFFFRRNCFIPSGAAASAAGEKTFLEKPLDSCEAQ